MPIGFPRWVPPGGTELSGYYIPEGNRVVIYHLATYRDPNLWTQPDKFHPERWLGDERFKNDHFDSFEPFSLGPRGCSGKVCVTRRIIFNIEACDLFVGRRSLILNTQNFAWNEMRLILATVVLKFDLQLRSESIKWTDQKVFLVWEKQPLMVNVKKGVE